MNLPQLPKGYVWDLYDSEHGSEPFRWLINGSRGYTFFYGEWRSKPFARRAQLEVVRLARACHKRASEERVLDETRALVRKVQGELHPVRMIEARRR